ncbi:N-acetyl-alpha-D-glucosaminyl-diphospho-ditrans,octacis-undecaprenol 4-epimerase [Caballeronia sp. SBC1]|uniref:UDP-glucose 4-epimerase family protein n=1 Tax=Caballeronia sp. SBC1 TaxID=2705548 RepID=UPI00140835A9|nr:SDR family oxidoreductase [Caballeronia sp. SBC1]QIN62841.1 N-acetyl-alpha-D-glucosaminyl-diphospho-ditrans,octacis-undecaprenol 4-epimerase [Caballeronia sp. SBC1]
MRVIVTGANGFVGRATCAALCDAGHDVTALVRRPGGCEPRVHERVIADDNFASLAALPAADVLIHLAARVHVMRDSAGDPLGEYRAVNVQGSLNVARAALRAGVTRLVFISSIKALGESEPGRPWREDDAPAPADPYGITKLEAERALECFGREQGMEIVVLRPPLVYGPGVRANFEQLMRAVERGIPLPLGAISVRRSMVYVGNLADAIRFVATRTEPTSGVFHVTDGDDLSVAQMIRALAQAFDKPARLLAVPASWLRAAGALTGRTAQVDRLTSPLRMDSTRLRTDLGWTPPITVAEGIARTVRAFQEAR